MKALSWLLLGTLGVVLGHALSADPPAPKKESAAPPGRVVLEAEGRTQCVHGRKAMIAPVPLHPVEEVYVKPGDRVKKEQKLVKIDDDEPQADVRNKKAILEGIRATLKEARRFAEQTEAAHREGALPTTSYFQARTALLKAEQDEIAAKAALESAQAELEHYVVVAKIDGVIAWLDVHPGMVSRPGTSLWGEILDLSEIDARCELTPDQADRVTVGQAAEVRVKGKKQSMAGRVAFVSIAADKVSGLVPVLVRVPNPKRQLRSEVPIQVRFTEALPANSPD